MEPWEQEYQDIIRSQKQQQKAPAKQQTQYINACWEEIEKPDGSKLYVPKQAALKKQERRHQLHHALSSGVKAACKTTLTVILILTAISGISFFANQNHTGTNPITTITKTFRAPNTYVNGLGLKNMANTLKDIRDAQTQALSDYVAGNYSLTDEEISAWLLDIAADKKAIETLPHDESYSQVVDAHTSLLDTLQSFITHAESADWAAARTDHGKYVLLLEEIHPIFASALKENNVNHALHEDGSLWFEYYTR